MIFPEATSTDRIEVIRFRRSLFEAAFDAETCVLPIAINYREYDGEAIGFHNRDKAFWYGDMNFIDHLWRVFQQRSLRIQLTVLGPLNLDKFEDRVDLVERAHASVHFRYDPIRA